MRIKSVGPEQIPRDVSFLQLKVWLVLQ
jgi:hypothetical protein